jgi:TonB family protein
MSTLIIYPAEAHRNNIQGFVLVGFVIDVDGSVIDATVVRSIHPLLDAEALRVVNLSPKWSPGYIQGRPVKTRYILPLNFRF